MVFASFLGDFSTFFVTIVKPCFANFPVFSFWGGRGSCGHVISNFLRWSNFCLRLHKTQSVRVMKNKTCFIHEDEGRDRSTVVINRLRETCQNVTAGGAVKCKHIRRDVTSKKKWLIFRLYFKKTLVNELYNVGQFLMYYICRVPV